MQSLYPPWKNELIALINQRNSTTFGDTDLTLSLDESSGANKTKVNVTAKEGSRWHGKGFISFTRRDIAKAFLGIPITVVIESAETTTIKAVIEILASRYGIVFDPTVDFSNDTLTTVVDFRDNPSKQITIPIANTSFVWRGALNITITNQEEAASARFYLGGTTLIGDIITIYPG